MNRIIIAALFGAMVMAVVLAATFPPCVSAQTDFESIMRQNDEFLRRSQREIDDFGRQRRIEQERRRREAVEDAENRLRRLDDWRNNCTWDQVGCPSRQRGRW